MRFKRVLRRRAFIYPLGALVLYVVYLTALWYLQDQLLYPGASAKLGGDDTDRPAEFQSVWVKTEPGIRVEGWYRLGKGRQGDSPGPAVLVGHGNYECIDDGIYHARFLAEMGCSVLLGEFRGYGRSGGRPTQEGITRDFVALYDWLTERPEVDVKRIVLYGRSLGGGPIAQLATQRPAAVVILESAFSSAASMAGRRLAPAFLLRDQWRTDEALRGLGRPVLILHGRSDPVIPIGEARNLHARVPGSELVEYEGGHTDFAAQDEGRYWKTIRLFLEGHGVIARE